MADFMKLVVNENMKIYHRVRTWIMLILIALFSILVPVFMYWLGPELNPWTAFAFMERVIFTLNTIFCVVIAAESVAGEFTWGTIKLLLIRPWSRSKILLSKFISVFLFSLAGTAVLTASGLLASFALFSGNSDFVAAGHPAKESLLMLLTDYIELFMTVLIAFMVSTVFRSASLAIGLSLFITFAKDLFLIFNPDKYEWAKYILFLHTDLSVYMHSSTGPAGVTFGFSAAVLAAYAILITAVTWIVFSKRDVAG